jgi:hypothetical protein
VTARKGATLVLTQTKRTVVLAIIKPGANPANMTQLAAIVGELRRLGY